ncbi:MAG: Fic family protein [Alphaproteobacteria bacterium]
MSQQETITFVSTDGTTNIDVHLRDGTGWLDLNELSKLLECDKPSLSSHIDEVFASGKLDRDSVVAFFPTTAGSEIEHFNLEIFMLLGYLVNSKRLIEFREWAAETLPSIASIEIINQFAKSWSLLLAYDEDILPKHQSDEPFVHSLDYDVAIACVQQLKEKLMQTGEASSLFGLEREGALKGILGTIDQTFAGEHLYKSVHECAAHLLYFIIKDHPFSDGNKRIGAFLFLLYLRLKRINSIKITDSTLVAIALMIAESNPRDKDLMVALIANLI